MRAAWILVFALLAGCARDPPPPIQAGEPTFSDAEVPPGRPFAVLTWTEVVAEPLTLAPAQPFTVSLGVPPGTLAAYVNVSLEAGALYGLQVQLADCQWARETAFAAGQAFAVDCGGVATGTQSLTLGTTAGAATGDMKVVALVCHTDSTRLPCPPPFPVTTS